MAKQKPQPTEAAPEVAAPTEAPVPVMAAAPPEPKPKEPEPKEAKPPSSEELMARIDSYVKEIEEAPLPAHVSREEAHESLTRGAEEIERDLAAHAADADPAMLERMARAVGKIRRRASDFGPVPERPPTFTVVQAGRYALNGVIHTIAKGSVVSAQTHDLGALRACNVVLAENPPAETR